MREILAAARTPPITGHTRPAACTRRPPPLCSSRSNIPRSVTAAEPTGKPEAWSVLDGHICMRQACLRMAWRCCCPALEALWRVGPRKKCGGVLHPFGPREKGKQLPASNWPALCEQDLCVTRVLSLSCIAVFSYDRAQRELEDDVEGSTRAGHRLAWVSCLVSGSLGACVK